MSITDSFRPVICQYWRFIQLSWHWRSRPPSTARKGIPAIHIDWCSVGTIPKKKTKRAVEANLHCASSHDWGIEFAGLHVHLIDFLFVDVFFFVWDVQRVSNLRKKRGCLCSGVIIPALMLADGAPVATLQHQPRACLRWLDCMYLKH